jgi:hypothetical protein
LENSKSDFVKENVKKPEHDPPFACRIQVANGFGTK